MNRRPAAIAAALALGATVALAIPGQAANANSASAAPRLTMTLTERVVELAGDVASASHGEVLARLAADHFPGRRIDTNLETAAVADVDWQVLTLSAVFVLAETEMARLVLAPGSLALDGIVDGNAELLETRVSRVGSAAGPGFSTRITLHTLDRSVTPARACRRMFEALGEDGIRFRFGTTEPSPAAHATLDRYVEYALDCPHTRLAVSGHTDSSGDEAFNLYLSDARAQAVRDYLVGAGIHPDRVTAAGKGSAEPIDDNKTAWGRTRNRRIEIELLP